MKTKCACDSRLICLTDWLPARLLDSSLIYFIRSLSIIFCALSLTPRQICVRVLSVYECGPHAALNHTVSHSHNYNKQHKKNHFNVYRNNNKLSTHRKKNNNGRSNGSIPLERTPIKTLCTECRLFISHMQFVEYKSTLVLTKILNFHNAIEKHSHFGISNSMLCKK